MAATAYHSENDAGHEPKDHSTVTVQVVVVVVVNDNVVLIR